MTKLLQKFPTMIIGCKKDKVSENKENYLNISKKVQNTLKNLVGCFGRNEDILSHLLYLEVGAEANQEFQISKEDLTNYI